jgi:hypothetical protein
MNTRKADWEILRRATLSSDPNERRQANVAIARLKHEGGKISSMREALVKAHRDGNKDEIKDIHDFVDSHREEYKNYW